MSYRLKSPSFSQIAPITVDMLGIDFLCWMMSCVVSMFIGAMAVFLYFTLGCSARHDQTDMCDERDDERIFSYSPFSPPRSPSLRRAPTSAPDEIQSMLTTTPPRVNDRTFPREPPNFLDSPESDEWEMTSPGGARSRGIKPTLKRSHVRDQLGRSFVQRDQN